MAQGKTGSVTIDGIVSEGVQGKLKIDLSETYDQAANSSNLSITHVWLQINSYTGTYNGDLVIRINGQNAVTLDGNSLNNSVGAWSQNTWIEVKNLSGGAITGSVDNILHNTDGTKAVAVSVHKNNWGSPMFMDAGGFGYSFADEASASFTLTTIPRQYTLSLSAGTGSTITVTRNGTALSNGATITYGDMLTINFAALTGYSLGTHTVNGTTFTSGGTKTVDGPVNVVATASPIRSTISAPNGTFGSPISITVTRYSTAYTHTIRYVVTGSSGVYTGEIATKSNYTGISWTPPDSIMNAIPNDTSVSCTLTCITYNGGTQVGTHSITITLSVPASVVPTLGSGWAAAGYSNSGTAASGISLPVVGYSKLTVTLDVSKITLPYSATLSGVAITYDGTTKSRSTSGTETFGTIRNAKYYPQSGDWAEGHYVGADAVVTDSRGRTASQKLWLLVYPYAAPNLSVSAFRSDSQGTAQADGTYGSVTPSASFTDLNGQNSLTLTYWLRAQGGSWGTETALPNNTATILSWLSQNTTYEVWVRARDSLGGQRDINVVIPTVAVAFNLKEGGSGGAFGKYAETAGVLDVAWALLLRGGASYTTVADYGSAWDDTDNGTMKLHKRSGYDELILTLRFSDASGMQISMGFSGSNFGLWYRGRYGSVWTNWTPISTTPIS